MDRSVSYRERLGAVCGGQRTSQAKSRHLGALIPGATAPETDDLLAVWLYNRFSSTRSEPRTQWNDLTPAQKSPWLRDASAARRLLAGPSAQ